MASLKAEKPTGTGSLLPGQAKQEPPKAAATPAAPKAPAAAAAPKAPAVAAAKTAAPKKADPKPTSQPKKKAPTAGKK